MRELVCEGHRGPQSAMQKASNRQKFSTQGGEEIMDYDGHHS